MSRIDRLYVMWTGAESRRLIVGELWRAPDGGFAFGYRLDLLPQAEEAGFRLLPEFPERRGIETPYEAPGLFSSFKKRIPLPSRADYQRILAAWGVESTDPLEILARSGGVQMTDHLELAAYRSPDDDLDSPLAFRLAGGSRTGADEALSVGMELQLQREADNPVDPAATILVNSHGKRVGWVPRQYSELLARHLDAGERLRAVAERELLLPEARGRWIVRVEKLQGIPHEYGPTAQPAPGSFGRVGEQD